MIIKKYIKMIEGDSTEIEIFEEVVKYSKKFKKVLVILDSNHTHNHVIKELNLYSKLISKNSYIIVLWLIFFLKFLFGD